MSYPGRLQINHRYQLYQGHLGRETGLLSTLFRFRKFSVSDERGSVINDYLAIIMIALISKQTSYKLESKFPVIIVETLASFSFPSLSMLISKTFMPKQTREINVFILFLPAFSGHLPARRECARKGLRSHARCHP